MEYLSKSLWKYRKKYGIDFVVANGENASEPNGIDKSTAESLFDCGVDVITTGNHIWRKSGVFSYLDDKDEILRPLNFPSANPGHGDVIAKTPGGYKILVMNVLGEFYMESCASPYESIEKCLERNAGRYDLAILDIHAESTGEKKALAYNFADRVSIIYGTHTHVQTSDAQVLGGCGYITDLGMCGDNDSILGVKKEAVIHKMKTKMMAKFDFATDGEIECTGAIFEINTNTYRCDACYGVKFTGEIL